MSPRFTLTLLVALLAGGIVTPLVGASTLQVIVGSSLKTAEIVATSNTNMVFTYPSTSLISRGLNGFNYSVNLSAVNVPPESEAFRAFQYQLRQGFRNITLLNMSVGVDIVAHANASSLVVSKTVVIQAWVTGIFNKTTSNRVVGNFGWKNFEVKGNLDVDFDGRILDINTVGSAMLFPFGNMGFAGFMLHSFGGRPVWSASTINFSALNTPLSEWARSYNPSTNTTTFSKTVSSTFLYREEAIINGENYTLSVSYDPSSIVVLPGYAVANGNTVMVEQSPPQVVQRSTAIIVSIVVIVIVVAASLLLRRTTH
ncbi:MAG: hypothetical protein QW453_05415 [Thermoprotei archaeon]